MSYFPFLNFCSDFIPSTTVFNFPPNNYQSTSQVHRYLYLHYSDGTRWRSYFIKSLQPGTSYKVTPDIFPFDVFSLNGTFLSLQSVPIPSSSTQFPPSDRLLENTIPAWRSTVSLSHPSGSFTSYQGEIFPFNPKSSLLTFNYLTQPDKYFSFLLFLSLESSPFIRSASLQFFHINNSVSPRFTHKIYTNTVNCIPLPDFFESNELVCIKSDDCSGIPLFFSYCPATFDLSLEHTHPPASLVIHGNRFGAQHLLKQAWSRFLN